MIARRVARSALIAVIGYAALSLVMICGGLLLTEVLLIGALGDWDTDASTWLEARRTEGLDRATELATYVANTEGIVAVAAVAVAVLLWRRRRAAAACVVVALVVELATFLTTTFTVDRPRPDVERLNSTPSTYSFPSGHTAATFALYGALVLILLRGRARIAGWVVVASLGAFVGFARVYRGMHHVTDVLAGGLVGLVALGVAWVACRP